MSEHFIVQDIIECSDDENYGFQQNQVIIKQKIVTLYIYNINIVSFWLGMLISKLFKINQ